MPVLDVLIAIEKHSATSARSRCHQTATPGSDEGQALVVVMTTFGYAAVLAMRRATPPSALHEPPPTAAPDA